MRTRAVRRNHAAGATPPTPADVIRHHLTSPDDTTTSSPSS
ncbi:hypothetical protein BN2537_15231 [Streptomyces venezuelae]|nr:hypothetical protein BN2537_15231 [Streptomyces venezuelae]